MKWKKLKFYLTHSTNKNLLPIQMSKNRLAVKLIRAENIITEKSREAPVEPLVSFKLMDTTKQIPKNKAQLAGNTWVWQSQQVEFQGFEPKNSLLQIIFSDQVTNQQIGVTYIHLSSLPKSNCK